MMPIENQSDMLLKYLLFQLELELEYLEIFGKTHVQAHTQHGFSDLHIILDYS